MRIKGIAKKNGNNGEVSIKSGWWHFFTKILPVIWISLLLFTALGKWTFGLQDMYNNSKKVPEIIGTMIPDLTTRVISLEKVDEVIKSELKGVREDTKMILSILLKGR